MRKTTRIKDAVFHRSFRAKLLTNENMSTFNKAVPRRNIASVIEALSMLNFFQQNWFDQPLLC